MPPRRGWLGDREAGQRLAGDTVAPWRGVAARGDIPPAEADLESAENDLARAKARHEAAARRLKKAKGRTDLEDQTDRKEKR